MATLSGCRFFLRNHEIFHRLLFKKYALVCMYLHITDFYVLPTSVAQTTTRRYMHHVAIMTRAVTFKKIENA